MSKPPKFTPPFRGEPKRSFSGTQTVAILDAKDRYVCSVVGEGDALKAHLEEVVRLLNGPYS